MASPNPEAGTLPTQQIEASTNTASQNGGQLEISDANTSNNEPTSQDPQASDSHVPPSESPATRFDYKLTQADLDQLMSWKPDYSKYPKPEAVLKRANIPVTQWAEFRYQQWLIAMHAHEIPRAGITDGLSLLKYARVWQNWIAHEKDPAHRWMMVEKITKVCEKLHMKIGGQWDATIIEAMRLKASGVHRDDIIQHLEGTSYGHQESQPGVHQQHRRVGHAHAISDGCISYLPNEIPIRESIETDDVNDPNGTPTETPSHTATVNTKPSHESSKLANNGGSPDGPRAKLQRQERDLEEMEEQYAGGDTFTKNLLDVNLKKKRKQVANLRKRLNEQEMSQLEDTTVGAPGHTNDDGRMDLVAEGHIAGSRACDIEGGEDKNNGHPAKRQRTDVTHQQVPAKPVASQSGPSKPASAQPTKVSRQHLIQTFLPALNTVLQQNRQKIVPVSAVSTWTLVDHMFLRNEFWPKEKETLKRIYFAEFGGEEPAIGDNVTVTTPKGKTAGKVDKNVKTSGKKASTTTQAQATTKKPATQEKPVKIKQEPKATKAGVGGSQSSSKGQKRKRLDRDDDDSDYHPSG